MFTNKNYVKEYNLFIKTFNGGSTYIFYNKYLLDKITMNIEELQKLVGETK